MRDKVIARFAQAFHRAKPENRDLAIDFLATTYDRFIDAKLADRTFSKQLIDESEQIYQQRVAELLLADWLWRAGFDLESNDKGPDFKATKDGISTWLELITPIPNWIGPDDQNLPEPGAKPVVRYEPHAPRSLRWTSSIKEKKAKLDEWLRNGVVLQDQAFVIVVNPILLNPWHFEINGISQLPYPVEVCFGVGPQQLNLQVDRPGFHVQIESTSYQQRFEIPKPNGKMVPSTVFLDPSFANVSAVLGIDLADIGMPPFQNSYCSALTYNPHANCPIPDLLFPAQEHWTCEIGQDSYVVYQLPSQSEIQGAVSRLESPRKT